MYFDDGYRKMGVHANWRLKNHSEGDLLSFQLQQIIE